MGQNFSSNAQPRILEFPPRSTVASDYNMIPMINVLLYDSARHLALHHHRDVLQAPLVYSHLRLRCVGRIPIRIVGGSAQRIERDGVDVEAHLVGAYYVDAGGVSHGAA
jgi:hypothetical protein